MLWGALPKRWEKGSPVEHIPTMREACCARLCCVLPRPAGRIQLQVKSFPARVGQRLQRLATEGWTPAGETTSPKVPKISGARGPQRPAAVHVPPVAAADDRRTPLTLRVCSSRATRCLSSRARRSSASPIQLSPAAFPKTFVPRRPCQPSPILRRLSRPHCPTLRLAAGRSGGAAAPRWAQQEPHGVRC